MKICFRLLKEGLQREETVCSKMELCSCFKRCAVDEEVLRVREVQREPGEMRVLGTKQVELPEK